MFGPCSVVQPPAMATPALTEGSLFSGFPAIPDTLAQLIVQLVVILGFIRVVNVFTRPFRQPLVIAEVRLWRWQHSTRPPR